MTQGKITCSACSHAFAVPPNARTAICPRCGQALPVFFGSIEPIDVPSKKPPSGSSEEEGEGGAQLARIKLKKRPVKKPPPLPKMPPPPAPDPMTVSSPAVKRPDLPPSAPPTIPQMMTDMPEAPGSFVGSPQFSKVPDMSPPSDVDEVGIDEPTYQMDGPPWLEPGMEEMTGPDLPRRIKGPPIDMAPFTPSAPPAPPRPDVPPPEDRSLVTKASGVRARGIDPPPPGAAVRPDLPGPPPAPGRSAARSVLDGDLPGPPVAAVPPVMVTEPDDLNQRATRAAKPPPLGPPPVDPLSNLPTEFEVEVTDDDPPPLARPDAGSYYDVSQSARVAALDAAITDAIEPGPTQAADPFVSEDAWGAAPPEFAPSPPLVPPAAPTAPETLDDFDPPPPGPVPPHAPPAFSDPPSPYGPAPSSVLPADDYQPLPGAQPPARPPTRQLGSQPPPAAPVAAPPPLMTPGPPVIDDAPESLGNTGITVFVPEKPIEEVQAGQERPAASTGSAGPAPEVLEAPAAPLSPRPTRARSAAGHGVAVKGAVVKADQRKSMLKTLLIVAGVAVVVGVGGLIAYLVLR